jgi:cytochrome c5
MSDHAHANTPEHEEDHTGPIKTPKQLLLAVFYFFVVPVFIIIALVYYVVSGAKPAAGTVDMEKTIVQRLQKVGTVEIRDANRELKNGKAVYDAQCTACHTAGVAGAPKMGDAALWAPRIATGYAALLASALKGKGAMAAQGGGDFEDLEIGRAVVFMANASGGKLEEPKAVAPVAADGAAPAVAVTAAATPAPSK